MGIAVTIVCTGGTGGGGGGAGGCCSGSAAAGRGEGVVDVGLV